MISTISKTIQVKQTRQMWDTGGECEDELMGDVLLWKNQCWPTNKN